jgi:hypothetical protein
MTFVYRNPNAPTVPPEAFIEVMVRGGRLYVPNDRGLLVESSDWAWFNGLWRAQRDRSADGRCQ